MDKPIRENNKTWAFFYQKISLWNTSIRYPGWVLETKEEMKNSIKNAYMDGFKIKIEKAFEVEKELAEAIYKLKRFVQDANDKQEREFIQKLREKNHS